MGNCFDIPHETILQTAKPLPKNILSQKEPPPLQKIDFATFAK